LQTITTYIAENWFLITVCILLPILGFLKGSLMAMKWHITDLESHRDWLQSWGLEWRDIALNLYVEDQEWPDDLKDDLKRVAARVKEETNGQRDDL
jgi:hypothetical protein